MNVKSVAYAAVVLAGFAAGIAVGRYATLDREYKINREGDQVWLQSQLCEQSYQLIRFECDFYLGSSDHHLNGVRAVAKYEGQQSVKPEMDRLKHKVSDLSDKIAKRQITDAVEDIADDIGDGWRNFKHNLIDGNK